MYFTFKYVEFTAVSATLDIFFITVGFSDKLVGKAFLVLEKLLDLRIHAIFG